MNTLIVTKGRLKLKIEVADIFYITTHNSKPHVLTVITEQNTYTTYGKLKELEAILGHVFYRCHRKYLVNLSKIKGIDPSDGKVLFFNPTVEDIACSRQKKQNLKKLWYHS